VKADKSKMFPVSLSSLKVEDGAPFPLFLFLRLNDKFVPIRLPGDPIGKKKFELFLAKRHHELWVPNNFQEIYKTYLEYQEKSGTPAKTIEEIVAATPAGATSAPTKTRSEEAGIVGDALADDDLTTEEKAEVLSAVSQDMMRALNQITTRGKEARAEGLRRCKEIADEILTVAAKNSNIYDEILALRNSQEDIEHSVLVGTMAAMFGMAIGYTEETLLADLTVGAIFHDIGLVRVKPEVMAKTESSWTPAERQEYQKHVEASSEILKESGAEFHPRVHRMVTEHHESYDGSGFPKGLRGDAIAEASGLLHLANLFDRLCTGKQTGTELSPAEAFDYIYDRMGKPGEPQYVRPELVGRVFQFMLAEKSAADGLRHEAEMRARGALKQNLQ
jgi:HD-GYP domain-containing protein (c-di-GMP phosphodiesterase class II)